MIKIAGNQQVGSSDDIVRYYPKFIFAICDSAESLARDTFGQRSHSFGNDRFGQIACAEKPAMLQKQVCAWSGPGTFEKIRNENCAGGGRLALRQKRTGVTVEPAKQTKYVFNAGQKLGGEVGGDYDWRWILRHLPEMFGGIPKEARNLVGSCAL